MPRLSVESGTQFVISFSIFGCIPFFLAIGNMYYGKGFLLTLLWLTLSIEFQEGLSGTIEFSGFFCLNEVLKNA